MRTTLLGRKPQTSLFVHTNKLDTGDISSVNAQVSYATPIYDPTSATSDHTVRLGDVMVSKKNAPFFGKEQLPYSRACLSGIAIENTDEQNPLANWEDIEREFWNQYAISGVSRKEVIVKPEGNGASAFVASEPVVVVHGLLTMANTGRERIEASEGVEAYLIPPAPRIIKQYRDGECSKGLSEKRVVPGTRAYDATCKDAVRWLDESPVTFRAFLNLAMEMMNAYQPDHEIGIQDIIDALENDWNARESARCLINKLRVSDVRERAWCAGIAQKTNAAGHGLDIMIHPPTKYRLNLTRKTKPNKFSKAVDSTAPPPAKRGKPEHVTNYRKMPGFSLNTLKRVGLKPPSKTGNWYQVNTRQKVIKMLELCKKFEEVDNKQDAIFDFTNAIMATFGKDDKLKPLHQKYNDLFNEVSNLTNADTDRIFSNENLKGKYLEDVVEELTESPFLVWLLAMVSILKSDPQFKIDVNDFKQIAIVLAQKHNVKLSDRSSITAKASVSGGNAPQPSVPTQYAAMAVSS